jgi:hypothetical protein
MTNKPPGARAVVNEIMQITGALVERGVVDDQNFPFQKKISRDLEIVTCGSGFPSAAILRDRPYADTYRELREARVYNFRMLDGALIQLDYEYATKGLQRHRLAFLPSPDLIEFQNAPDLYLDEVLFAEVVERRVVAVPLRFDYDCRDGVPIPIVHPHSHLTIGQYSRCRIPVTAPLTPLAFTDFILRNFYNTAFDAFSGYLPKARYRFSDSIQNAERRIAHIGVSS